MSLALFTLIVFACGFLLGASVNPPTREQRSSLVNPKTPTSRPSGPVAPPPSRPTYERIPEPNINRGVYIVREPETPVIANSRRIGGERRAREPSRRSSPI